MATIMESKKHDPSFIERLNLAVEDARTAETLIKSVFSNHKAEETTHEFVIDNVTYRLIQTQSGDIFYSYSSIADSNIELSESFKLDYNSLHEIYHRFYIKRISDESFIRFHEMLGHLMKGCIPKIDTNSENGSATA